MKKSIFRVYFKMALLLQNGEQVRSATSGVSLQKIQDYMTRFCWDVADFGHHFTHFDIYWETSSLGEADIVETHENGANDIVDFWTKLN